MKRQQFFGLLARGWTTAAARREVGISRSTSRNWRNGYKLYRKDGTVSRFVPPLDPVACRVISARFLSEDERIEIADRRRAGETIRAIAAALGRAPSTVSRELRRNTREGGQYRPFEAHRRAVMRRSRPRPTRLAADPELLVFVRDLLQKRWSPAQISRRLRARFPGHRERHLAAESIYREIYRPHSLLVRRAQPSPLRTGRDHRRAQVRLDRRRRRYIEPMLSIKHRPFPPADRSEPGHWEGDLITGRSNRSAIGTLVERHSRYVKLIHMPRLDAAALHDGLIETLHQLPTDLRKSITWDQGWEMARHAEISAALGSAIYFCDPGKPWQRGSNENTNGLLRQYFPKATDLARHTSAVLARVENELNHRPRAVLNDRTPAEIFGSLLASEPFTVLR
ncbi:IS30 family transposase [Nocardia blacklockiae]|uniref:IS30 family transposase n=1 Tax=Nocardia blacklockiae TaxID=480036 RepID=UPI001E4C1F88